MISLQLALDAVSSSQAVDVIKKMDACPEIIEAGTPLLAAEGLEAVRKLKKEFPESVVLADLKIMDAPEVMAKAAFDAGADLVTVMSTASDAVMKKAADTAIKYGKKIVVDFLNDPVRSLDQDVLNSCAYVCVHLPREEAGPSSFNVLDELRRKNPGIRTAVAGGLNEYLCKKAAAHHPGIAIIGKSIYGADDPGKAAAKIRKALDKGEKNKNTAVKTSLPKDLPAKKAEPRYPSVFYEKSTQVLSEIQRTLSGIDPDQIQQTLQALFSANRIFVTGVGRAGLEASGLAMRLMHLGLEVHRVEEVTCPAIGAFDLLIAVSGSGASSAVVNAAKTAKKVHADVLAITTNPESELADLADSVLVIPANAAKNSKTGLAENPVSVQPLSNLFIQALCLTSDLLVMDYMNLAGIDEIDMSMNHTNLE